MQHIAKHKADAVATHRQRNEAVARTAADAERLMQAKTPTARLCRTPTKASTQALETPFPKGTPTPRRTHLPKYQLEE